MISLQIISSRREMYWEEKMCSRCIYWQGEWKGETDTVTAECRRFPPAVSKGLTIWPKTNDFDHCGEFKFPL